MQRYVALTSAGNLRTSVGKSHTVDIRSPSCADPALSQAVCTLIRMIFEGCPARASSGGQEREARELLKPVGAPGPSSSIVVYNCHNTCNCIGPTPTMVPGG